MTERNSRNMADDSDVPSALHRKLVCVAKRGRFSHLVPARVWQAPDGRVLQVLDDSEEPLTEEFYKALVDFEREEELRIKQKEDETAKNEVVNVESISTLERVPEAVRESTTTELVAESGAGPVAAITTYFKQNTKKTSLSKKKNKSLVDWFKRANNNSESDEADEAAPLIIDYSRKRNADLELSAGASGRDSQKPQMATSAASTPPKDSFPSSSPSLTVRPGVSSSAHFNPSHSLIHKWNPIVRSRCFVYPSAAIPAAGSSSNLHSNLECLLWIRVGCLRTEHNLALQQALWLRRTIPHLRTQAVSFVPSEQSQPDIYLATLQMKKTLAAMDIPCHLFDHTEETSAVPLFALWTRNSNIIGILTSENYQIVPMKTASAVARAIKCPLFAFDSEYPIPIRFVDSKCGTCKLSRADFHTAMANAIGSIKEKGSPFDTEPVRTQSTLVLSEQVPDVVLRRFQQIVSNAIELPKSEAASSQSFSKSDSGETTAIANLETSDQTFLSKAIEMGTMSLLARLLSPELLAGDETLLYDMSYRTYQEWQAAQAEKTGSPATKD